MRHRHDRRAGTGCRAAAVSPPTFVLAGLSILSSLLFACSSDDGGVTDPTVPEEPVAEAVIGPAGGELVTDELVLTVPADAFVARRALAVEQVEPPGEGPGAVTPIVRLSGLPPLWHEPLVVRLAYEGSLRHESGLYRMEVRTDPTTGRAVRCRVPAVAHESGGWLEASIVPTRAPDVEVARRADDQWLALFGLTGMRTRFLPSLDADPHLFVVHYHDSFTPVVDALVDPLQDAYAFWRNEGVLHPHAALDVLGLDGITVEVDALFTSEAGRMVEARVDPWEDHGSYAPSTGFHVGRPTITYERDDFALGNLDELRRQTGAAVFTLTQLYNCPWMRHSDLWWRRAVAQWSRSLFPPTDSYVPPGVEGTERVVLEGLAVRDDWTSRLRYGDAWTSVVEYLTDRHGRSVIAAAAGRMRLQEEPTGAVLDAIGESPSLWWPEFVVSHVAGLVYPVEVDSLLAAIDGEFAVTDGGATTTSFTDPYADLSARRYRIDLERADFGPDEGLRFRVHGDVADEADLEVLVFTVAADGTLDLVDGANDVTVAGLDALTAADLDLLAVVTCAETIAPYDGTRPVTLDVELGVDDPGIEPQDYDRAWMRLVHHTRETNGEEHPRWRIDTRVMRVNLEDGAFVTEWDSVSADSRRFGHFEIELAEDPLRVVRLDLHQEASYLPRPEYGHNRVELQGSGVLPFDEANSHDDGTYHAFRLEGSDACAFVDRIEEVHYNWAGGNLVYELGTWECNDFSSLEVRLYYEE